jgi:hypothetical protein
LSVRIQDRDTIEINTDVDIREKCKTTNSAADNFMTPAFIEGGLQRMDKLFSRDKSKDSPPQEDVFKHIEERIDWKEY